MLLLFITLTMAEDTDILVSGILTVGAVTAGIIIGSWLVGRGGDYMLHSMINPTRVAIPSSGVYKIRR